MKEEKKIRKKIKIEDLLPRDPIRVDLDAILGYVKGKTILVTGGGGSIGSDLPPAGRTRRRASDHF